MRYRSVMEVSAYLHASLDVLGIAVCEYDAQHRAVSWNSMFLELFPEHAGHILPGEPYADNLRRFYETRLDEDERAGIERYVAEGIARHEAQTQPFEFMHRGRRLRASSLRSETGNRVRLWQIVEATPEAAAGNAELIPILEALQYIPDGATIVDGDDRIIATNSMFRALYDIPVDRIIAGRSLDEIVSGAWRPRSPARALQASIRNGLRYDGAPLEIELPGERWRRVIARHMSGGIGFYIHADITAVKRQQLELLRTQDALRAANAELATLARTDALTGLENRRSFMERLDATAGDTAPFALLLLDIDHFKSVSDRFGHVVGDACLASVASAVAGRMNGASSFCGRIGGEEFALLLAGADPCAAMLEAEAIRTTLRAGGRGWPPELAPVTVSIGICVAQGPVGGSAAYASADEALYLAKRNGRDRVETLLLNGAADSSWRAAS